MALAVEGLRAAYGEIEVLHGIDLTVEKGEIVALLGANGAGKSTAIKAIMGLVKPSGGRILLDGRDLTGQAAHLAARHGIALVPEGRKIFKKMTVEENLQVGGVVRGGAETRERLADIYAPLMTIRHATTDPRFLVMARSGALPAAARAAAESYLRSHAASSH